MSKSTCTTSKPTPYHRLTGVPKGHHYLCRVLCFGDFEVPYRDEILFHSDDYEELAFLCWEKGWSLTGPRADYRIARH